MAAVLGSLVSVYNSANTVKSTISTITDFGVWVSTFLDSHDLKDLDPKVKRMIEQLGRRCNSIAQPLNLCLFWSQEKGSVVAESIHATKEMVKQVYGFLADCSKHKQKLRDREFMINELSYYIQELDFCSTALHMSLSLIHVVSQEESTQKDVLSPSNLIQASARINEMYDAGGDIAVFCGYLFVWYRTNTDWEELCPRATLKVVRNKHRGVYELHAVSDDVSDKVPLSKKWDITRSLSFGRVSAEMFNLGRKPQQMKEPNRSGYQDAFTWVDMIANRIDAKYVFVFKNMNDDWDIGGFESSDDDDLEQISRSIHIPHEQLKRQIYEAKMEEEISSRKRSYRSSLYDSPPTIAISSRAPPTDIEMNLSDSVQSLRNHVHRAKNGADMLAPGGDFDDKFNPVFFTYIVRLCMYENDNQQPIIPRKIIPKSQRRRQASRQSDDTSTDSTTLITTPSSSHDDGLLKTGGFSKEIPVGLGPSHVSACDEALRLALRNPPFEEIIQLPQPRENPEAKTMLDSPARGFGGDVNAPPMPSSVGRREIPPRSGGRSRDGNLNTDMTYSTHMESEFNHREDVNQYFPSVVDPIHEMDSIRQRETTRTANRRDRRTHRTSDHIENDDDSYLITGTSDVAAAVEVAANTDIFLGPWNS